MIDFLCTFVVPTRNDGYGGITPEKLANNINYLICGLQDSSNYFEVVIVEWNPVATNESFASALSGKIENSENVKVKIYTAPNSLHDKYRGSDRISYCGTGAINFGIRRASGKYCVVKVHDTFYSCDLLRWFSAGELKEQFVYRADRYVVGKNLHATQLSELDESELFESRERDDLLIPTDLHTNACGDFMLMETDAWFKIRGLCESKDVRTYGPDGLTLAKAVGYGLAEMRLPPSMVVFKPKHKDMYTQRNTKPILNNSNRTLDFLAAFPKKINATRHIGQVLRYVIFAFFNWPTNFDGKVKVDSIYRFDLKYKMRLCLAKYIKFGEKDWGSPDFNSAPGELN